MSRDPKTNESLGTGRRKSSVARVRIRAGKGDILINKRSLEDFFHFIGDRNAVMAPLKATDQVGKVDISVRVHGGGTTGQAGAILLGVARALTDFDGGLEESLRDEGLLTRDPRMKERKKCGLHGARKGTQFSKR